MTYESGTASVGGTELQHSAVGGSCLGGPAGGAPQPQAQGGHSLGRGQAGSWRRTCRRARGLRRSVPSSGYAAASVSNWQLRRALEQAAWIPETAAYNPAQATGGGIGLQMCCCRAVAADGMGRSDARPKQKASSARRAPSSHDSPASSSAARRGSNRPGNASSRRRSSRRGRPGGTRWPLRSRTTRN